uniref:Uncharacterized protein n=1 Tax=Triticum urartu TaxID=4572 RepID=A0A8R7JX96_TRIUA
MLDVAQPTFHFYHKTEKTSEVVGAGVKKLEAAMHAKSPQAATTTMRSTVAVKSEPASREEGNQLESRLHPEKGTCSPLFCK